MKTLIQWFAGFFEDQGKNASSKRATLYVTLFFLYMIVKASIDGQTIDLNLLILIGAIILFCVGAITSEFMKELPLFKKDEKKA